MIPRLRASVCVVIIPALFAVAAPAAGSEDPLPLLPADTNQIGVISFENAIRSELFQKHLGKSFNEYMEKNQNYQEFERTGFKGLKRVLIASTPPRPDSKTPGAGLIVVVGSFDGPKVIGLAREMAGKYGQYVTILQEKEHTLVKVTFKWGETLDIYVAVVDEHRLVIGAAKEQVLDALKRAKSTDCIVRNKEVIERLGKIDPASVVYLTDTKFLDIANFTGLDDPSVPKFLQELASDPVFVRLVGKVTEFRLDLRITADIKLHLTLEMPDDDCARELRPILQKVAGQLKGMLTLIILQRPMLKPFADVGKTLKVEQKGKTITVQTTWPGEAVDRLVKSMAER
jgi:hypothetical protein